MFFLVYLSLPEYSRSCATPFTNPPNCTFLGVQISLFLHIYLLAHSFFFLKPCNVLEPTSLSLMLSMHLCGYYSTKQNYSIWKKKIKCSTLKEVLKLFTFNCKNCPSGFSAWIVTIEERKNVSAWGRWGMLKHPYWEILWLWMSVWHLHSMY